jgi:hypothetical protein
MAFKKFLLPVVGVALISSVAACSRTSETLETGDIFAPVPTASPPVIGQTPIIQTIEEPIFEPLPVETIPVQQQIQYPAPYPTQYPTPIVQAPLPAPVYAQPAFDCSIVPTSKSGLSLYRANCL